MGFATQLTQDLDRVEFRDYGESVTHTPSGGSTTTVTAIVNRDPIETEDGSDGLVHNCYATVLVRTADVAAPLTTDVWGFKKQAGVGSNVNWNVVGDPQVPGDGVARIRCYRRETVEKSAQAHRIERG